MNKEEAWLMWMKESKNYVDYDWDIIKKSSWWEAFSRGWDAATVNTNGWDNAYMLGVKAGKEINNNKTNLLFCSVESLSLDVRATNCLQSQGIYTVGELCDQHTYDLKKIPNLGKVTFKNIVSALAEYGLKLKT